MESIAITPQQDLRQPEDPDVKKVLAQLTTLSEEALKAKAEELGFSKAYAELKHIEASKNSVAKAVEQRVEKSFLHNSRKFLNAISWGITALSGLGAYLFIRNKPDWSTTKKSFTVALAALGGRIISFGGMSFIKAYNMRPSKAFQEIAAIGEGIQKFDDAVITLKTQMAQRMAELEKEPPLHATSNMATKYATPPAESKMAAAEQSKATGAVAGIA